MKRNQFGLALLAALVFGLGLSAHAVDEAAPEAAEAEQVTLTGTMTCAKCDLKQSDKCQSVLIVGEGDEKTTYYLADNEVNKENHKHVCMKAVDGVKITGTVSENDEGKKMLTASKIEMPKSDADA